MKTKFFGNVPVRKRFGQNFLTDKNILGNIVEKAGVTSNDFILEVGPGHGALTEILLNKSKEVHAVEIDRDLSGVLKEKFQNHKNFKLTTGDVLDFNLSELELNDYELNNRKVIGNIPYYITTPIIMKFINEKELKVKGIKNTSHLFSEIIILIQKEVADRMVAKPGTKDYGALSVICQYACEVEHLLFIGRKHFYPVPQVDSQVVKLKIKNDDEYDIKNPEIFWKIIHGVFISRRKNLRNSLKIAGFSNEQIEKISNKVDLSLRGETFNLNDFSNLSNLLSD